MACKDKRAYFSFEEAQANCLPKNTPYECPVCGNWHTTSNSHKRANKARIWDRKKRKKKR